MEINIFLNSSRKLSQGRHASVSPSVRTRQLTHMSHTDTGWGQDEKCIIKISFDLERTLKTKFCCTDSWHFPCVFSAASSLNLLLEKKNNNVRLKCKTMPPQYLHGAYLDMGEPLGL